MMSAAIFKKLDGLAGRDDNTSVVTLLLSRNYHIVNDDIKQYGVDVTFYLETWKNTCI